MENPEEILHSLEEFSKMKPKDIPRELEDYLCYVAKTGNPIYQWQTVKSLFREKLLNVITEFYESCPAVDIPPCPNVEMFNYELMKNFILERLDTFSAAPFTVQRICELLTTPRKEYNRIDKYMRALEKNILVVSTTEPGNGRRSTENGEGIVNGIETEHLPESGEANHDINVEEMDESPSSYRARAARALSLLLDADNQPKVEEEQISVIQENFEAEQEEKTGILTSKLLYFDLPTSSNIVESSDELIQQETIITCHVEEESEQPYMTFETDALATCTTEAQVEIPQEPETTDVDSASAATQQTEDVLKKLEDPEEQNVEEPTASEQKLLDNPENEEEAEEDTKTKTTPPSPPPPLPEEELSTNEAIASVPSCSDLDIKLPSPEQKPCEDLTVSESGLPQDDVTQLELSENLQTTLDENIKITEETKQPQQENEEEKNEAQTTTVEISNLEDKVDINDKLLDVDKNGCEPEEKPIGDNKSDNLIAPQVESFHSGDVNIDHLPTPFEKDTQVSSNDIPMEIDIVNEPTEHCNEANNADAEPICTTSEDVSL